MPVVLVQLPPVRRRHPLTFAMALTAVAEQGLGDRRVASRASAPMRPYVIRDAVALTPDFFRTLHRVDDSFRRQVIA